MSARTDQSVRTANKAMNQMLNDLGRGLGAQPAVAPVAPGPVRPARRYVRDDQQSLVYDAERRLRRVLDNGWEFPTVQIAGSTIVIPQERKFADLAGMQAYIDHVLALDWAQYPGLSNSPIQVRESGPGEGQDYARYTGGTIRIPTQAQNPATGTRWAMREVVLLHELAHHVVATYNLAVPAHGPEFVNVFRDLCSRMIGPEMTLLFDVIFRDEGVRM